MHPLRMRYAGLVIKAERNRGTESHRDRYRVIRKRKKEKRERVHWPMGSNFPGRRVGQQSAEEECRGLWNASLSCS